MADVTIDIIKNGPYIVKGAVELKDADGRSYPAEQRMALCRCGASTETILRWHALEDRLPGGGESRP